MLPTHTNPENLTDRPAIKRDFNDLDSLLNELNTPKEVISSTPLQGATPQTTGTTGTTENTGKNISDPFAGDPSETVEPMPDELAQLSGKTIANTIDTALGTGFSLYAKNTTPEKYQASGKQLSNLEDAWTAVAKKYNYRVEDSPWFNVILLTVAVYLPHFQEAKTDRRFAQVDERIKEMEARYSETEKRLKAIEEKEIKPAA